MNHPDPRAGLPCATCTAPAECIAFGLCPERAAALVAAPAGPGILPDPEPVEPPGERTVRLQRGETLRVQCPDGTTLRVRIVNGKPDVSVGTFMGAGGFQPAAFASAERVFALCPACPDRRACGSAEECLAGTKAGARECMCNGNGCPECDGSAETSLSAHERAAGRDPAQRFGCADCGRRAETMDRCAGCGSFRVVLVDVAERAAGAPWGSFFPASGAAAAR